MLMFSFCFFVFCFHFQIGNAESMRTWNSAPYSQYDLKKKWKEKKKCRKQKQLNLEKNAKSQCHSRMKWLIWFNEENEKKKKYVRNFTILQIDKKKKKKSIIVFNRNAKMTLYFTFLSITFSIRIELDTKSQYNWVSYGKTYLTKDIFKQNKKKNIVVIVNGKQWKNHQTYIIFYKRKRTEKKIIL